MDGRDLMLLTLAAIILICSAAGPTPAGRPRGLAPAFSLVPTLHPVQSHRLPSGQLRSN